MRHFLEKNVHRMFYLSNVYTLAMQSARNDEERGEVYLSLFWYPLLGFRFYPKRSSFVLFFLIKGYYRRIQRPVAAIGANQLA